MTEHDDISITYFINPHLFWYKNPEDISKFFEFDYSLQTYFIKRAKEFKTGEYQQFEIGEYVCCYFDKLNKYLRGIVLHIELESRQNSTLICWAVDFGYPLTVIASHVFKLPDKFCKHKPCAQMAGLDDVKPTELHFDKTNIKVELKDVNEWSPNSIKLVNEIIENNTSMMFVVELENTQTNHAFGRLTVFNENKMGIDVRDILIKMNYCKRANKFQKDFERIVAKRTDILRSSTTPQKFVEKLSIERFFLEKFYTAQSSTASIERMPISSQHNFEFPNTIKASKNGRIPGSESSGSGKYYAKDISTDDKEISEIVTLENLNRSNKEYEQTNQNQSNLSPKSADKIPVTTTILTAGHLKMLEKKRILNQRIPENILTRSSSEQQKVPMKPEELNDELQLPVKLDHEQPQSKAIPMKSGESKDELPLPVKLNQKLPQSKIMSMSKIRQSIKRANAKSIVIDLMRDNKKPENVEGTVNVVLESSDHPVTYKPKLIEMLSTSPVQMVDDILLDDKRIESTNQIQLPTEIPTTSVEMPTKSSSSLVNGSVLDDNHMETTKNRQPPHKVTSPVISTVTDVLSTTSASSLVSDALLDEKCMEISNKIKSPHKPDSSVAIPNEEEVRIFENPIQTKIGFDEITRNFKNELDKFQREKIGLQFPRQPRGRRIPSHTYGPNVSATSSPTKEASQNVVLHETNASFTTDVSSSTNSIGSEKKNSTSQSSDSVTVDEIVRLPKPTDNHQQKSLRFKDDGSINQLTTFIGNEMTKIVLVHSINVRIPNQVENIGGANFSQEMYTALTNLNIKRTYRIQSYAWPHLNRGNSILLINPEKSGKTTSYIPPIMDLIIKGRVNGRISNGIGPVALIIVPSAKELERVYEFCYKINKSLPVRLVIKKAYGLHKQTELLSYLYNGMDILIITPGCLARALRVSDEFINARCKHVVIDNLNLMMPKHEELQFVLHHCLTKNSDVDPEHFEQQIVVASTIWYPNFLKLLRTMSNPLLCIGSYIEAAVYGKHNFKFILTKEDDKLIRIHQVLVDDDDQSYLRMHTVIICTNNNDVKLIVEYLREAMIPAVGCHNKSTDLSEIKFANNWNECKGISLEVIVCTDSILPELHLNKVKRMIHYSLPDKWHIFSRRFSAFFESISNILNNEEAINTSSFILVDETNNRQLPRLVEFLESEHGFHKIHPSIKEVANHIQFMIEEEKMTKGDPFCEYFLDFGQCRDRGLKCKKRHVFSPNEQLDMKLKISNFIKIKVYEIHSPTHYSAEILATRANHNDKWTNYNKEEYNSFSIRFKLYYGVKSNHASHMPAVVGDLCTIAVHSKYYRCKILDIAEKKSAFVDPNVLLKFIDMGYNHKSSCSKLLELPDEFKRQPPRTIDIRLGGIVPTDNELTWDNEVTDVVKQWMKRYQKKDANYVRASVAFATNDTIWVDAVNVIEDLKSFGGVIQASSIKSSLIKLNYCIEDAENFNILKELASKVGLDIINKIPVVEDSNLKVLENPLEIVEDENDLQSPNEVKVVCEPNYESTVPIEDDEADGKVNSNENERITQVPTEVTFESPEKSSAANSETTENNWVKVEAPNQNEIISGEKELESWQSLSTGVEQIHFPYFQSPARFYVQKISSAKVLNNRETEIQEHIAQTDNQPLIEWNVGDQCLVKFNDVYYRAKIAKMLNDNRVNVFLTDEGDYLTVDKIELKKMPQKFMLPIFETIECSLFGLKPKDNIPWSEDLLDKMYKEVINPFERFYAKMVQTQPPNKDNKLLINHFRIIMVGANVPENICNINHELVKNGFATYDDPDVETEIEWTFSSIKKDVVQAIQKLGKKSPSNAEMVEVSSDLDVEEFEINFNTDEFDDFFKKGGYNLKDAVSVEKIASPPPPPKPQSSSNGKVNSSTTSRFTEITSHTENLKETTLDSDDIPQEDSDVMPPLVSVHALPAPQTIWQQTADRIIIKVNVTDQEQCSINIQVDVVYVLIEFANNLKRELLLNLYGCVDVKHSKFRIRGNYLIIDLVKGVKNISWDSLLDFNQKPSWLKYNYDSYDWESEGEDDNNPRLLQYNPNNDESDSSSVGESDDSCDLLSSKYGAIEDRLFGPDEFGG